jgi:hypothetical protein
MSGTSDWNGKQYKILREAVIKAYPDLASLEMILFEDMGIKLSSIPKENNYDTQIFKLIIFLDSQGRIQEFIQVLIKDQPKSPYWDKIKEFIPKLSIINIDRKRVIEELNNCLCNLELSELKNICKKICPKQYLGFIDNINNPLEILDNIDRIYPSKKYNILIVFIVEVQQKYTNLAESLGKWLTKYGSEFGYGKYTPSEKQLIRSNFNFPKPNKKEEAHLLISVENSNDKLLLKSWLYHLSDSSNKESCFQIDKSSDLNYDDLPLVISSLIHKCAFCMSEVQANALKIEFFLTTEILRQEHPFEWITYKEGNRNVNIGEKYPVTFRLAERIESSCRQLSLGNWQENWNKLPTKCQDIIEKMLCESELKKYPKSWYIVDSNLNVCLALKPIDSLEYEEISNRIYNQCIPVLIWSRSTFKTTRTQYIKAITQILSSCEEFHDLPNIIHKQRKEACINDKQKKEIAHHLCLLWDDPRRIPPEWKEDQQCQENRVSRPLYPI